MTRLLLWMLLLLIHILPAQAVEQSKLDVLSASEIVRQSQQRHELYPYVYEEQTLVLIDNHQQRDVRRLRRYSRLEDDGSFRSMIEFVYPESIAGTALLFTRNSADEQPTRLFLPALGARLSNYQGAVTDGQMLGSEFCVIDLVPEDMERYEYQRESDLVDQGHVYFVVRAKAKEGEVAQTGFAERRLFIRQDNFFITRIEYFDAKGRLLKRQTRHDIHAIGGEMWRADMIGVENMLNGHRSILKIDQRIYSRDYVPLSIFSEQRLLAQAKAQALAQQAAEAVADDYTAVQAEQP